MSIIPRKVFSMNDMRNKKIVQHNDLITSVAKMDKVPLKIFELAVACLDTKNIPENRTVFVSKKLLFSLFESKSGNKYARFKRALLKVHQQAVFFMQESTEKKEKFEYQIISPLEKTSWNDYEDFITIKFTESIMPYLIELKENFTQYLLSDIAELNSKYSIIIYKWLSMNYNKYEYYKNKGNRREEQLEEYRNPIIDIDELRRITDTENEYQAFSDFEKRILKQQVKEINQHTQLNVTYEKLKFGRSIKSIQFHVTKKSIVPIDYKQEQQDEIYLESKQIKEQEKQLLVTQALESKYTTLLIENMFIGYKDFQNTDMLASLQKILYPLYDELKDLRGLEGVKNHIAYVSAKQEGYSKKNIVKYLKTAVEGYIVTVKIQEANN